MKSTLVIARRELQEKRFVFVAATAFAALSVVIPFIPGIRAGGRREVLAILSSLFAINFAIALAMILGATIVGREISERRLSFYFSKPVPAMSIWFGKLIAALLLIVLSAAIIATPGLIAGMETIVHVWTVPSNGTGALAAIIVGILAAAFLLAHVIGTFVRSRSAWIIFDFIAAAVCGTALWYLAQRLAEGFALGLIKSLGIIFAVFAAVAIVGAGAWQLASGRTDRKRSHIELSRFLWMSLGCGLLILAAYVMWVVSVTPADLRRDHFWLQANSGSWAVIGGQARHRGDYTAAFLYNLDSGRSIRIPQMQPWWATLFSADTNIAYWTVPSADVDELWMARLNTPNPKPVTTKITMKKPAFFNFSEDGSRLAVIGRDGVLTVYDVASGTSLGSARLPGGDHWVGFFVRPDVVRMYAGWWAPRGSMPVFEYDLVQRVVTKTGELPVRTLRLNREHTLAFVPSNEGFEIRDARTGALLQSVSGRLAGGRFLRDGRIAALARQDHRAILRIFSATGAPLAGVELPSGRADYLTDAGGGRVVVAIRDQAWSSAVVDIDRGAVIRVEPGLRPLFGNAGPRLICHSETGIVAWTPATGAKRIIAGQ